MQCSTSDPHPELRRSNVRVRQHYPLDRRRRAADVGQHIGVIASVTDKKIGSHGSPTTHMVGFSPHSSLSASASSLVCAQVEYAPGREGGRSRRPVLPHVGRAKEADLERMRVVLAPATPIQTTSQSAGRRSRVSTVASLNQRSGDTTWPSRCRPSQAAHQLNELFAMT